MGCGPGAWLEPTRLLLVPLLLCSVPRMLLRPNLARQHGYEPSASQADVCNLAGCHVCCRRLARIRLSAAFAGWQQRTAELAAARQAAKELGQARDASLLQECLVGWADTAAQRAQQQAALMQMVQRRAAWLSFTVLHHWRAYVQHKQARRAHLQRVVRKLSALRQRCAFSAWQRVVADRQAEEARLALAERRLAARHAASMLAHALRSWRAHTAALAAARAAVHAKAAAQGAVVRRHVLAAWRSRTEAEAVRRDHILRVCVARRCALLQSKALVAWQLFAQVRSMGGCLGNAASAHPSSRHNLRCTVSLPMRRSFWPWKITPPAAPYPHLCSGRRTTARRWS